MKFIMKYFQWRVKNEGVDQVLFVDFGVSSRVEVDFLIEQVQIGARITVTEKMQRAFSFTDFPMTPTVKSCVIVFFLFSSLNP